MRKYASVITLFVRSTLSHLLILLGVMAVSQTVVLSMAMEKASYEELAPDWTIISLIYAAGFILLTLDLCRIGCNYGAKTSYTIQRLQISERAFCLCQAIYNGAAYLIFWAFEVLILWALCFFLAHTADPSDISLQATMLTFFNVDFLHGLLPLAETSRYIRNIFLVLGMGAASAYFPFCQRRGKLSPQVLILTTTFLATYSTGIGSFMMDMLVSAIAVAVMVSVAGALITGKEAA